MVKIQIRARNVEVSADLRTYVERNLVLALGRFGQRIERVIVRFSDAQDEGSHDKRCQIHVGLQSRSARVEDTNADLFVAVDRATERLCRAVALVLEREREWLTMEHSAQPCKT
jgi:ribosomal subunit interface protein